MKRTAIVLIVLLAIASVLAACGGQAPQTPGAGAGANTKTAIIGFTASLTGSSNVESTRQVLWLLRHCIARVQG